jgi:glycine/D-amino acid oxidase-like deaminating enzyme
VERAVKQSGQDIVIVGGGVMGSALAYWLTHLQPGLGVCVVERDPTYRQASSALSAASIRQQYTTAVNIRISQWSLDFLRRTAEHLAVDDDRPEVGLHEGGYLYLAGAAGVPVLEKANRIQREHGADVVLLDPAALAARFPWLEVGDLALGSLGLSGEGWFDGYRLLTSFARKARSQGVRYVRGEVAGMARSGNRVDAVLLADGTRLACDVVVNAAGPWARQVAAFAGVDLPVRARRRTVFVVSCPTSLPRFPLLIDTSGLWIRPEGAHFIGGVVPRDDADDLPLEPDTAPFETEFWPALAARVPAFEQARLERAWAGYYEMSTFDHNAIVGPHPDVANLHFMNGFSGHGIQQAAAVGRALAERITTGRYVSVDLEPLAFARVLEGRPLLELNVIG